jgi:hypothetical protein
MYKIPHHLARPSSAAQDIAAGGIVLNVELPQKMPGHHGFDKPFIETTFLRTHHLVSASKRVPEDCAK